MLKKSRTPTFRQKETILLSGIIEIYPKVYDASEIEDDIATKNMHSTNLFCHIFQRFNLLWHRKRKS